MVWYFRGKVYAQVQMSTQPEYMTLNINYEEISCFLGGSEAMCCRVEVKHEIIVAPGSEGWVPIKYNKHVI